MRNRPVLWLIVVCVVAPLLAIHRFPTRLAAWLHGGSQDSLAAMSAQTKVQNMVAPAFDAVKRYPDPAPSDLLFVMDDHTGLNGSWNFEIANCSARFVQSWTALAGHNFSCASYMNVDRALRKRKITELCFEGFPPEEAARFAREVKASTLIQIQTEDTPSSQILARARSIDPASAKVTHQWQVLLPKGEHNREGLFDVQQLLSREIAATLCGFGSGEQLVKNVTRPPTSSLPAQIAWRSANRARHLTLRPTLPRLMEALRLTNLAVQKAPGYSDAWVAQTLAFCRLCQNLSHGETHLWRQMTLNALVSGEIAFRLAPDNTHARIARLLGMAAQGRVGQATRLAAMESSSHPEEPLFKACYALLCQRSSLLPTLAPSASPRDKQLFRFLSYDLQTLGKTRQTDELLKTRLREDSFSPCLWQQWGERMRDQSELTEQRIGHTGAAIVGALHCLCETARQWELADQPQQTERLARELGLVLWLDTPAVQTSTTVTFTQTPLADALEQEVKQWCASSARESAMSCIWWQPTDLSFQLLEMCAREQSAFLAQHAAPVGVTPAGYATQLTAAQCIEIAKHSAADGAAQSFLDLTVDLRSLQEALRMGKQLENIFPDDLAVLDAHVRYHFEALFDNVQVNDYHHKIYAIDYAYGPARRRNATFGWRNVPGRISRFEELCLMSPFHYPTLLFAAEQLEKMEAYEPARAVYDQISERFPLEHRARLSSALCHAMGQRRLPTPEELARLEAEIPADCPNRRLILADAYRQANNVDKALSLYEGYLASDPPAATESYLRASWLAQLKGQTTHSIELLESYLKQDPSSLRASDILLEISNVLELQNDLPGARQAWKRAAQIDAWKRQVLFRQGWLEWCQGNDEEALAVYQRYAQRYPGNFAQGCIGWLLLAKGEEVAALEAAQKGLDMNFTYPSCFELKSTILRRQGKLLEAQQTLEAYNARMGDSVRPMQFQAWHYFYLGQLERAIACAEEAFRRSRPQYIEQGIPLLARFYIEHHDFDQAQQLITQLRVRTPTDTVPDILQARLSLARSNPSVALALLDRPLRIGQEEAHGVAAEALLALGQPQEALRHAQLARSRRMYPDIEWVYAEAQAHAAIGNKEQAREDFKLCTQLQGPQAALAKRAQAKLKQIK